MLRATTVISITLLALTACQSEHQDIGQFRIASVKDGFAGFGCPARTELYFLEPTSSKPELTYLGTCATPEFVTEDVKISNNPGCFAVSASGAELVYYHRPELCGAGAKAQQKASGVYLYSRKRGDRLLYRDQDEVLQLWSKDAVAEENIPEHNVPKHNIIVRWVGEQPSRRGAQCLQNLLIDASGKEQPTGQAGIADARCQGGQQKPPAPNP